MEVDGDDASSDLLAKKVERLYVEYDINALKKRLDKEIFNKVSIKEYYIENLEGLVELLREAGVKPKEFKEYLKVTLKPNRDAIKELYAIGEIEKEDLKGCYTAKLTKSIQISELGG